MNPVEQQIAEILPEIFTDAAPEKPAPAQAAIPTREVTLRRARAYLEATPPAIAGAGGDPQTFTVCCRLVRGFDLSDGDALEVLRPWNARCVPPWTEGELLLKIAGARKYGDEPIGARLDDPRHVRTTQDTRPSHPHRNSAPKPGTPQRAAEDRPACNQTDAGNAEYFAQCYRHDVQYDHARGRWLVWRTHRWQPDADAEIRRLAKAAMRRRFREAAELDDPDARARLAKWALASESRGHLEALLSLAEAERPLANAGGAWDLNRGLLGAPNGVVDLRTGDLRAGERADRITMAAGVDYDPGARSALWESTLANILVDPDVVDFFQVAVGYSATGDMRRDCWFLGCGDGRNGKGTLYHPIRRALGDYALEVPASVFDRRQVGSPYDLAALPGKRFVTSSEAGDTITLNHDRIKQLTGGDPIRAAQKYERSFEFEPTCKLWLACNTRPRVSDDSPAFWARVYMLPFPVSFAGREDRDLRPTLERDPTHQRAVLAWIVRGAVRYYAGDFEPPAAVRAATSAYREESDPLAGFLAEAIERTDDEVAAATLYKGYRSWAERNSLNERERLSATKFGRLMSQKFEKRKDARSGVSHYLGITLKEVFP